MILASLETLRAISSSAVLFFAAREASSSEDLSKWSSMVVLSRPVTMMISVQPAATASSTPYWIRGLSTRHSISLGMDLVAGRKRVPKPAAGKTALRILGYFIGGSLPRRWVRFILAKCAYL